MRKLFDYLWDRMGFGFLWSCYVTGDLWLCWWWAFWSVGFAYFYGWASAWPFVALLVLNLRERRRQCHQ